MRSIKTLNVDDFHAHLSKQEVAPEYSGRLSLGCLSVILLGE